MNIRRHLILTYIALIPIFIIFISLILYTNTLINKIGKDIEEINDIKNQYTEIVVTLNNITLNWSGGKYLSNLVQKMTLFENEIIQLSDEIFAKKIYSQDLKENLLSIHKMWTFSSLVLHDLINTANTNEFKQLVQKLEANPSMQSLNDIWLNIFYSGEENYLKMNYKIYEIISGVEDYSTFYDTFRVLFGRILSGTTEAKTRIMSYQILTTSILVFLFIITFFILSFLFSAKLSCKITNSIRKLISFLGTSIEKVDYRPQDELKSLEKAVDLLIEHYVNISENTKKLSRGDITSGIQVYSKHDVVGIALNDVREYLCELNEASEFVQNGQYNVNVKIKSDNDLLSKTFNLMLDVINEKIRNLKNMIDTIEEGFIVIDKDMKITETNKKLLNLFGCKRKEEIPTGEDFFNRFPKDKELLMSLFKKKMITNHMSEIATAKGEEKPVKISSKIIDRDSKSKKIMFFVTDESWKVRINRERDILKTQTEIAELRALRAQISPHFLFNTLNAVNELIETMPEKAVEVIDNLSELFRYVLSSTKQNLVRMAEEIKYIQLYLDIERIRFGERLTVEYRFHNGIGDYQIPPMLFQPLVENVIKHGEDGQGKIFLGLSIKTNGSVIQIEIEDRGNGINSEPIEDLGVGTGVKNVNSRLRTLYNTYLTFINNKHGGLTVSFEVPIIV